MSSARFEQTTGESEETQQMNFYTEMIKIPESTSVEVNSEISNISVTNFSTEESKIHTDIGDEEDTTSTMEAEKHSEGLFSNNKNSEEGLILETSQPVEQTEKIDTKLNELDEVVRRLFTTSYSPEERSENKESEENITENKILDEELMEISKEFEDILKTTLSSEEILENLEEETNTSMTMQITEAETATEIIDLLEKTFKVITDVATPVTNPTEISFNNTTSSVERGTNSPPSSEIAAEITAVEDEITDFYTSEVSSTPSVHKMKFVTGKVEEKLGELDEIVNEFLTSTTIPEALVGGTEGEENTEKEELESELEELKHEFQLMLNTTIAPEYLLEAVEDVLAPTTMNENDVEQTYTTIESPHSEEHEESITLEWNESSSVAYIENNKSTTVSENDILHYSSSGTEEVSVRTVTETEEIAHSKESETTLHSTKTEIGGFPTKIEEMFEEAGSERGKIPEFEFTSELPENEIVEGEEFDSNLLHLPEDKMQSTICEICSESEIGETHPPSVLKIGSTISPGHNFKSSRSPGESDKGHETRTSNHDYYNGTTGSTFLKETGYFTEEKASTYFEGGTIVHPTTIKEEEHVGMTGHGLELKSSTERNQGIEEVSESANSPGIETTAHLETSSQMSEIEFSEEETTISESYSSKPITTEQGEIFSKPVKYNSRQSETPKKTPETSTSKIYTTQALSNISLLTTLLLSLVTSTTQIPEKSTVSTHLTSNISGPQNIPKCLVVFITGESPLLPLNGTKWVPSECPHLGEASTTSHVVDQITSTQAAIGRTEISNTLESTVIISESASTTNRASSSTTEHITTTLVSVEELPEIISNNFVEGGCSETDFENNNKCFCMLDLTVDQTAEDLEAANSTKPYTAKCSKFLKVNMGLVMRNETPAVPKRSRRSYLYLKYLNRQKRETVEYNKIDEVLANELTISSSDKSIYTAVGGNATLPCFYKDEVIERENFMKYVWTSEGDKNIIFSDRLREATDGALKILEVSVEDGGNYTCSINRPFGNTDTEHKLYVHELLVIAKPIFKVKATIMYTTDEPCTLKDGDVVHAYLPKMLENLLCGIHKRVCKVEMERPSCVEVEDKTYLTVKYIVTLDGITSLVPSISEYECDFNCQMKLMGSLMSLLIKNVETSSVLDVISEIQSFNHTFKPREVKFPTDRSAVEDLTLLPKLVIGCPAGFGIQKSSAMICVACPPNTYNSENSSRCSSCPRDHYQPKIGSTSCIECKTPFDDKACVGMMFANKAFFVLYIGSSVAIVFCILLCIFCAQSSTQATFGGPQRKKKATTPKRRRIGRKDVEDPAEITLLSKDPSVPKIVKGPRVPPPDF